MRLSELDKVEDFSLSLSRPLFVSTDLCLLRSRSPSASLSVGVAAVTAAGDDGRIAETASV